MSSTIAVAAVELGDHGGGSELLALAGGAAALAGGAAAPPGGELLALGVASVDLADVALVWLRGRRWLAYIANIQRNSPRPPVWTADGQIAYRLKRPWPNGRTELVLPPVAFLRRLCGIIPPPRRYLVRYAGVFGPASQRRAQLRALVPVPADEPQPGAATPSGSARAGRVPRAELLSRVFATAVLSCPCGGRRTVVAVVVDSAMARAVLANLGLPCAPATFTPARAPPQAELWFDDPS